VISRGYMRTNLSELTCDGAVVEWVWNAGRSTAKYRNLTRFSGGITDLAGDWT
jgi:hypothetical protein